MRDVLQHLRRRRVQAALDLAGDRRSRRRQGRPAASAKAARGALHADKPSNAVGHVANCTRCLAYQALTPIVGGMAAAEDILYALTPRRRSGRRDGRAGVRRVGARAQAGNDVPGARRADAREIGVAADVARAALDGEAEIEGADRRFADRAWRANPLLRASSARTATSRWAHRTPDSLELDGTDAKKAHFGPGSSLDAAAPSNFARLNPEVVKEGYDTGGRSFIKGAMRFAEDVVGTAAASRRSIAPRSSSAAISQPRRAPRPSVMT